MYLCGLQKLSMVDYPGKLAATVFTGGCNLRCPFCHNALLVTRLDETPKLSEQEILNFLASRKKLLDGVVLSGGEPLMQPDAAVFLKKVRDMGFAVKLDTNGCYPEALATFWSEGWWTMWPWTSRTAGRNTPSLWDVPALISLRWRRASGFCGPAA